LCFVVDVVLLLVVVMVLACRLHHRRTVALGLQGSLSDNRDCGWRMTSSRTAEQRKEGDSRLRARQGTHR